MAQVPSCLLRSMKGPAFPQIVFPLSSFPFPIWPCKCAISLTDLTSIILVWYTRSEMSTNDLWYRQSRQKQYPDSHTEEYLSAEVKGDHDTYERRAEESRASVYIY